MPRLPDQTNHLFQPLDLSLWKSTGDMSGFPFTNSSQHFNLLTPYYTLDANGHQILQQGGYSAAQGFPSPTDSYGSGTVGDVDDLGCVIPVQGAPRSRRRIDSSGEQSKTKFRRTRSGCYTCRNRRVKCDEGRPTCERCRKGHRECLYPEPLSATTKPRSSSFKGIFKDEDDATSPDSGSGQEQEFDVEPSSAVSVEPSSSVDELEWETSSPITVKQVSPAISGRMPSTRSRPRTVESLPEEIRFYVKYVKENLKPGHWNFNLDESNFVSHTLVDTALQYDPLLYAVTCFGAYHYSVHQSSGRISHFLKFHSASVKSLRESLVTGEKSIATLLTILQLATIEEVLGDWVNLMSHQKAAYRIMTELWTPETFVKHGALRMALKWYLHFDFFIGAFSQKPPKLPRAWIDALNNYYANALLKNPDNIQGYYEEQWSYLKILTHEAFSVFARLEMSQGISETQEKEGQELLQRFAEAENLFPPKLLDPSKLVMDFSDCPPLDPDDIYNAHEPGLIFGGELFPTNQLLLSLAAMRNMLDVRLRCSKGLPRLEDDAKILANRILRVFNAVRYWPHTPAGALLCFRSVFPLGVVLQPPTGARELRWTLKQFQAIENEGYNFPQSIRETIEAQTGQDFSDCWLPEGPPSPPIFRMIREFIQERSKQHTDETSTKVREMKGFLSSLSLSEASSPESIYSPSSSAPPTLTSPDNRSPSIGLFLEIPKIGVGYEQVYR